MSSIFDMILEVTLCVQHFCDVIHCKSAYKNGFHFICVPCMLEHFLYEPFS